jgi:glucosamine 6-phosphate synthetase-like amidotransferase/phosphosugar isomerase protein
LDYAHEELRLIQNLIIAANGSSKIAAEYGSLLMKELNCFNTVRVFDGHDLRKGDLERLRYGGYLTLSQSGESQALINNLKIAKQLDLTCINVVNVEDSPITKVFDEKNSEDGGLKERNIGFYMKSGYCYSDIKSFIP